MRCAGIDVGGLAEFLYSGSSSAERACRIHNIVQDDAVFAFNTAYDIHDFGLVCLFTAFIDNSKIEPELHGEIPCAGNGADIGRNNYIIIRRLANHVAVMLDKDITAGKIVNGNIEKALNLCCVQIHRQDSVRSGSSDEVCYQLCGNRIAASGLAILPGIAEIGNNGCDTACGGTAAGINHNKEFHHVVIDMITGGLNDKDITTTNGFLQRDGTFSVSELGNSSTAKIHEEIAADILCKLGVGIAGKDF